MKKLKYLFIILVLVISMLPLFVVEAASTTVSVNRTITDYSADKTIVYQVGIGSASSELLGGNEGTLSIGNVNYSGSGVSLSGKRISGNNAIFTFSVNEETFTELVFNSFVLNATISETPSPTVSTTPVVTPTITPTQNPDGETPTPTPTNNPDNETPSPTPDNETPSPTPDGQTPSPTPEGETPSPSPTPTSTANVTSTPKKTAKPTKRPSVVETTKDPYDRNWKTQAPPTIPPDVTATPYATPVAGVTEEESTPPPSITEGENEVNIFFIICMCLILLLIIDLFIILWRKRNGYGTLINNGIARRKVRDDLCDYPESAPEQTSEASETTETTE